MISALPCYDISSSPVGSKGLVHVSKVTGINGLSTGSTSLLQVSANSSYVLIGAVVRLVSTTGDTPTVGELKIKDATASVDLIAATALTGLTSSGKYFPVLVEPAVSSVVPAGNIIAAEITTAFTDATTLVISVDLIGYLI